MKNYWLIAGGITAGIGLCSFLNKEKEKSTDGIFEIVAGTAIILIGIYGFKK